MGKSVNSKEKHPGWKGGKTQNRDGYILVLTPKDHPPGGAGNGRYVLEHRLVMEDKLGRFLLPSESVHHKNGIKSDNRIENLELRTSCHVPRQSVDDLVNYAVSVLQQYKPELLR